MRRDKLSSAPPATREQCVRAAQQRFAADVALAGARTTQLKPGTLGRRGVEMPGVKMSIQAHFCGPVSVGTVDVIKAIKEHAGLTLREAKALVDRCVFEGETVTVECPSDRVATTLIALLRSLPDAPPIDVEPE